MAIFRADHYLIAEFDNVTNIMQTGEKVLAALKDVAALKDLAMVTKRMEGKQWSEILGRIDIPEGSKAFWAMVKKEVNEREPYNLFIRFDRNAEGETIDDARSVVKAWVEKEVVPRIKSNTAVKSIKVLQANELYMPKLN